MKNWQERPFETRNLFNPAFCGMVMLRSLRGFEELDPQGMPFSLSLLVLPLCLHRETRRKLLSGSRSYFIKTVEENPDMLVGFPKRATALLPFTLEALGVAMQHGCFNVSNEGNLKTNPKCVRTKVEGTDDTVECQNAARIIGKQFARVSDRITIYTTLGVRP